MPIGNSEAVFFQRLGNIDGLNPLWSPFEDFAPLTLGEPLPSHVINPTSNAYAGNDTGNTTLVNLLLREFGQINEKRRLQGSFF